MERRPRSGANNAPWSVIKACLRLRPSEWEGLLSRLARGSSFLLLRNSFARVAPFWANRFALCPFPTPLSERGHDAGPQCPTARSTRIGSRARARGRNELLRSLIRRSYANYASYTYDGGLCWIAIVAIVLVVAHHGQCYLPFWGREGKSWRRATIWWR